MLHTGACANAAFFTWLLALDFGVSPLEGRRGFGYHIPTTTIPANSLQLVSSAWNLGVTFLILYFFLGSHSWAAMIRNSSDHITACTTATSLIHSKLDNCNSLFLNIIIQRYICLQIIVNFAARTSKFKWISSSTSKLARNHTTHTIQHFHYLTNHLSTTNLHPFLIFSLR